MSDPVTRINALTANARSTWLALLTVLIFSVVTLVRVEHIDFYGVDRATELPLVGLSVPTALFFYGAPILIFAVYGYFHLYLIRLWDALGAAPGRVNGTRLGEAVSPWLMTDAALSLRTLIRKDGASERRETDYTAMALNFTLSWLATPIIVAWMWWASMPARDIYMSTVAGIMVVACIAMGSVSARMLWLRMWHTAPQKSRYWRVTTVYTTLFAAGVATFTAISYARTFEPWGPFQLANVDLTDQRITQRPSGWLPAAIARREAEVKWCKREEIVSCKDLTEEQANEFSDEWDITRRAQISDLRKPAHINTLRDETEPDEWLGVDKLRKSNWQTVSFAPEVLQQPDAEPFEFPVPVPRGLRLRRDLRGAVLNGAFLPGVNLFAVRLEDVQAAAANLEHANLSHSALQGANLSRADLNSTRLHWANLTDATLNFAQLQGADFRWARLRGANLERTQLRGADLRWAQMQGADLSGAQFQGAKLTEEIWLGDVGLLPWSKANLQRADLTWAQLPEADLRWAQLQGASLSWAHLQAADLRGAQLQGASLSWAMLQGADLRRTRLQNTSLAGAQLQGTIMNFSLWTGTDTESSIPDTSFDGSINSGGALRKVDLTTATLGRHTDWRNVFMDTSVTWPSEFSSRMGTPCQWLSTSLKDDDFYAHWAGWILQHPLYNGDDWKDILPKEYHHVTPHDWGDCKWKTVPFAYGAR
ncbi:MAG: pentapeptide repeat-containing protein [Paracoccaceae bacterium]